MAIAFIDFLRSLFGFPTAARSLPAASSSAVRDAAARPARRAPPALRPHRPQRPLRPLRVVRAGAGRLVISGRMADVCAELDRLAALEAAQALAPAR